MPATQEPLLNSNGHSTYAANGSAAGWYDDPSDSSNKRYWDGQRWTEHVARPSKVAPVVAPTPASDAGGGFFGRVRRRPALAFWSTLSVALVVGIALGAASAEDQAAAPSEDTELSSQLDDARGEVGSLEGQLADAQSDLDTMRDKLSTTRDRLRDARAEAKEAPVVPAAPIEDDTSGGAASGAESFSGNGSRNLGTITVAEESVLKWTNDGELFLISDDDFSIHVSSDASSGETILPAGTYKNVEVGAVGNWTIEISSR